MREPYAPVAFPVTQESDPSGQSLAVTHRSSTTSKVWSQARSKMSRTSFYGALSTLMRGCDSLLASNHANNTPTKRPSSLGASTCSHINISQTKQTTEDKSPQTEVNTPTTKYHNDSNINIFPFLSFYFIFFTFHFTK